MTGALAREILQRSDEHLQLVVLGSMMKCLNAAVDPDKQGPEQLIRRRREQQVPSPQAHGGSLRHGAGGTRTHDLRFRKPPEPTGVPGIWPRLASSIA